MKKLALILTAVTLFVACDKDKPTAETKVLSPDGKQWFMETNGSPQASGSFLDLSLGNGTMVMSPATILDIKSFSDFYFYIEELVDSYSIKKSSDDDDYVILYGNGASMIFTPLSEDTGIMSFNVDKKKYNIICRTVEKYTNKTLSAVDYYSYRWVLLNWKKDSNNTSNAQIAVEDVASSGFKNLSGNYEIVVLTVDGAEEDYEGKDVKGKIVFVADGESLSFFKKRDIAFSKQAAAIIVYHPTDSDGVKYPYKKTFDSIPKYLGIPCGVLYESDDVVQEIISSGSTITFSTGK